MLVSLRRSVSPTPAWPGDHGCCTDMNTVDEILEFAIGREQEASDFYLNLAGRTEQSAMKKVFFCPSSS